jgi:hypothetical protein
MMAVAEAALSLTKDQKLTYAGIWLLKKMDLRPEDGGMVFPIVLPSGQTPLEEVLEALYLAGYVSLDRKKERYQITAQGYEYIGMMIDEAQALVDEFQEYQRDDVVRELRARHLDVFRARFLWEWYTGELDDLVLFQERRGIAPVERLWAYYLVSDEFYKALAADLG